MKSKIHRLTAFSVASLTIIALIGNCKVNPVINLQPVNSQEPVLEAYTIGQGGSGSQSLNLDGFDSRLNDQTFGGGSAKSIIQFNTERDHSNLFLQVYRVVPNGTITFALIVTRVEVRAFNSQGAPIYSQDLGGFVFGDSKSGNWSQSLFDLPANVAQIKVTFFGNYE
jgi:hypothetical protein